MTLHRAELAEARGWTVLEPPARVSDGRVRTVLGVNDRRVMIEDSSGEDIWKLEVRVRTPDPGLPAFRITHEGFVSFIAGAFGGQDIQLGVPHFDYEYRVQSSEPDELRRVWTAERCRFLLDHVPGTVVQASHDAIWLEVDRSAYERKPECTAERTFERAIELAVDLAHAEVYGVAALRALPGAVVRRGAERGPYVELDGPSPIAIGPTRRGNHVVTRATMPGALPVPPPATARLGEVSLTQDGESVSITWPHVEDEPARLIAAIELLRGLSSGPHDGAYR